MYRPFPSSPGPLYQLWFGNYFPFSCKITHCLLERLCTWPHFESEGFWNSEVAYFLPQPSAFKISPHVLAKTASQHDLELNYLCSSICPAVSLIGWRSLGWCQWSELLNSHITLSFIGGPTLIDTHSLSMTHRYSHDAYIPMERFKNTWSLK